MAVDPLTIGHKGAFDLLAGLFPPDFKGLVEARLISQDGEGRVIQSFYTQPNDVYLRNVRRGEHFNVYVGVAPRAREAGTKDAIESCHSLWVDVDSEAAAAKLVTFDLPPSAVVASGSPGHLHAYYFIDGPAPADEVETLNRRLAERLDGDVATVDASRVMRLPGTYNFKTDPPTKAEMLEFSGTRYPLARLREVLGEEGDDQHVGAHQTEASAPVERVLARLEGVRRSGGGWSAHCPAHDDARPSLSIAEGDDGRCLLNCHAGCEIAAVCKALGIELAELFDDDSRSGPRSIAAEIVAIVQRQGAVLFHDPGGRAFAAIEVEGRREVWPVESRSFKRWLRRQAFERADRVANSAALEDAAELLCAMAEFDGEEREVHVRVAATSEGALIDLADDEWRAIEVEPDGWRILARSPVPFLRTGATQSIPAPTRGGSIDDLRPLFNVSSDADWRLVVAFLVAALSGRGPFPVLILQGEKGSAKSTAARVIRRLVDPVRALLRGGSPDVRDLMIQAEGNWIVAFDNVSRVSARLSDALCQLSTGAGFGTRRLYTDDEEMVFDAMRPIVLNGIADLATRPDLLSRAIVIELEVLGDEETRPEEEFWAQFDQIAPSALGGLLDALVGVFEILPGVRLERSPRMADFARLGVAVERTLGWPEGSFPAAYGGQEADALTASLDADPVAAVLLGCVADGRPWSGSPTELLQVLTRSASDEITRRRSWPPTASELSKRLKALLPPLRAVGIEVEWTTSGRGSTKERTIVVSTVNRDAGSSGDGGDA